MNQQQENRDDQAVCLTNSHGRLLGANRRFCRMFGVQPDEVEWRYLLDFHRRVTDWEHFHANMESYGEVHAAVMRLRHRKGRSFQCVVSSQRYFDDEGLVRYRINIQKVAADAHVSPIATKLQTGGDSVVYLMVCHGCGKVKSSEHKWIQPVRKVNAVGRKAHYCPDCSEAMFPGVLGEVASAHR